MTLCSICSALDLEGDTRLGEYTEVKERDASGCEACYFFCTVVETSKRWSHRNHKLPGRILYLENLSVYVKREESLGSGKIGGADVDLDICVPEDTGPQGELDCRRLVPINPRDKSCYDLIKSWLRQCSEHTNCPTLEPVLLPRRVIVVPADPAEHPRLHISYEDVGQYIALSHCWGGSITTKLQKSTIDEFQRRIDVNSLPQNFRDAIDVTRSLGFQYLWIDALCIIQDSPLDWVEHSLMMASVYGRATLTISATVAAQSDDGFLHDRHVPYSPAIGKDRNRYLRQAILSYDWDIENSPLASRGWAAQERMLAPRVVHFTTRQIVWECASGWYFEASGVPNTMIGSGAAHIYRKKEIQPIFTETLLRKAAVPSAVATDSALTSTGEVVDPLVERLSAPVEPQGQAANYIHRLRAWQKCVNEFTKGELTVPSDKLAAMAGIAAIVNNGTLGDYLAGIWSRDIAANLAWHSPVAELKSSPSYRAPSWSWASVDGTVSYSSAEWDTSPGPGGGPAAAPPPPPEWMTRFELKLLAHNILLQEPASNPYIGALEGSHIVVEGAVLPMKQFNLGRSNKFYVTGMYDEVGVMFHPGTVYYDSADSCEEGEGKEASGSGNDDGFGGRHKARHEARLAAQRKVLVEKYSDTSSQFFLVLQATNWKSRNALAQLLLLQWTSEDREAARRIGTFGIGALGFGDSIDSAAMVEEFTSQEWERQTLKLV